MTEPRTESSPAASAPEASSQAETKPTEGQPAATSGAAETSEGTDAGAAEGASEDGGPPKKRRRRRRRKRKPAEGEATAAEGEAGAAEGNEREGAEAGEGTEAAPRSDSSESNEGKPGQDRGHAEGRGEGRRRGRRDRREGDGDGRPRREGRGRDGDGRGRDGEGRGRDGERSEGRGRDGERGRGRGGREGERGRGRRDGDRRDRGGDRRERSGERGSGTLKASLFSHLAQTDLFNDVVDEQVQCRKAGCEQTWTWSRDEQLAQRLRLGHTKPPARLCPEHFAEERSLRDEEVECRVRGCGRTWTWSRDAQLKHRSWLDRQKARLEADEARAESRTDAKDDAAGEDEGEGKGKGRRRRKGKRRRKLPEGPPPRMCSQCEQRIATFEAIEQPCKVHGCDKTWLWTKEQQLEAWVALKTDDLTAIPKPPRRMCESCRDFCRGHQDREMPCGKPGCDFTWTYKVGAQLQDALANRSQEPVRLACTVNRKIECEFSRHEKAKAESVRMRLPPGAELMPCVVPGCEERWVFVPGMALASAAEGELAPDRMCDAHRAERDLPARNTEFFAPPEEVPALAADPAPVADDAAQETTPSEAPVAEEATEADAAPVNEGDPATSEPAPESASAPEEALPAPQSNAAAPEEPPGDEPDPS